MECIKYIWFYLFTNFEANWSNIERDMWGAWTMEFKGPGCSRCNMPLILREWCVILNCFLWPFLASLLKGLRRLTKAPEHLNQVHPFLIFWDPTWWYQVIPHSPHSLESVLAIQRDWSSSIPIKIVPRVWEVFNLQSGVQSDNMMVTFPWFYAWSDLSRSRI